MNKHKNFTPGFIMVLHTFGRDLKWNPHIHCLISEGGSVSDSAVKSALSGKVIKYTISMVTVIPILVVYPFMQRYFEKGIMLGAVKG